MNADNRHIIKKLALKFLGILLILCLLDILYFFTFYKNDVKNNCTLMEYSCLGSKEQRDAIYLGESSNHTHALSDTDQRTICKMIDDELDNLTISSLSKDACHASIYYDIIKRVHNDNLKYVIVTVNMRSFSSEWIYSDLETALRKEQVMMKYQPALYKRLNLAFKGYEGWREDERKNLVINGFKKQSIPISGFPYKTAYDWDKSIGTTNCYRGKSYSMDTISMMCHYIKCFAYALDDKNPRIKDFDKIVTLCKKRGWQPVFNILADNVDQINTLLGHELVQIMHQNAQYVMDRYRKQGVIVVNNQNVVRDKDFIERDFPSEHYAQDGRAAVAKNVAEALRNK